VIVKVRTISLALRSAHSLAEDYERCGFLTVRTLKESAADFMRTIVIFAGLMLAAAGLFTRVLDKGAPANPTPTPVAATAVAPAPAASSGRRSVIIPRDHRGHFQVQARIDGRSVGFMVDTGASVIALTESDARRLGIHPVKNDYKVPVQTANGTVRAAAVTLNSVDVGGLVVRNVQALVAPDNALKENLLGLSYLTKLKRFEYANNKLVLEQ
jgi:aspartyl protease family protein